MTADHAPNGGPYGYRALIVWQRALELAVEIHRLTACLPPTKRFGLAHQLNRAAVSVASNIAEGSKRTSRREFQHFLTIAHGSLAELDTQMEIAVRVGYVTRDGAAATLALTNSIGRMLTRLRQRLRRTVT